MSKDSLLSVVREYRELETNVADIINQTGYKSQFIAKRLKLPMSTYYLKKRTNSFSAQEVEIIVNLISDDALV